MSPRAHGGEALVTTSVYTEARNRAYAGAGYDGVVRISAEGSFGSGVLLYGGVALLTSAHLFAGRGTAATIQFETMDGVQTLASSGVSVLPSYDAASNNNDLAIVWLAGTAPLAAERYSLYRAGDERGQTMTMVGYGLPGSGNAGIQVTSSTVRLKAENQFEADAATLKAWLGSAMAWTPTAGTQLVADFDDGTTGHDALGWLIHQEGTGLGQAEGLLAPGDSGGPAFINGQVAGIASYTARLSRNGVDTDIDGISNSSYGEIAVWQRCSAYQQWIDQSIRAHYANAPTKPEDVQTQVAEGNTGTSYAYFLLQFTGTRSEPNQILSVDYATRDGSAVAGEDYLSAVGTLVLYPGENQAVIPVEIVGDVNPESDEFFSLVVTNPVGGSFGEGRVELVAVRSIIDDDGAVFA